MGPFSRAHHASDMSHYRKNKEVILVNCNIISIELGNESNLKKQDVTIPTCKEETYYNEKGD